MIKRCGALSALLLTIAALCAAPVEARTPGDVPRVYALTGARVVVAPGRALEPATVVLRDGVIEAVGTDVQPPADARVREMEGLTIYPGLIDPYTVRALPRELVEAEKQVQGLHDNGLVRPHRRAVQFARDDASAQRMREAGFTVALVAPKDGLFRGASAVVALGNADSGNSVLRESVAQHVGFESHSWDGGYPNSLMGSVALFRQTLLDTEWWVQAREAWNARPAQERPPFNAAWQELAPVVAGSQPVVFESGDLLGSLRAARLAREHELQAILVGNGFEYQRLDDIRAAGFPHILPVAFPRPPRVTGEEGDLEVELEELRHWDAAPGNPAAMIGTGLPVALTTFGLEEPKALHGELAKAIERGLAPEAALAAVTTTPARLLGVDRLLGTVEPGKLAFLTVAEGDLFTGETTIREVWIDGRPYRVRETRPPEVEPAGAWELQVHTPDGQTLPVVMELSGSAPSLSGTLGAMGISAQLATATVSGSTLEVSLDGSAFGIPGAISMTLEIRGERLEGSGSGPMGPFTVTGSRTTRAPEVAR
jgi:hypothetical protein